jgi:ABC-type lipoprotein release transport system permease subunit
MMIPSLSWKNVWRNPVRSTVVICAVVIGTWSGIFISAFSGGMVEQYLQNELNTFTSHIQIHHPRYLDERLPEYDINHPDNVREQIAQYDFVRAVSPHTLADGLAMSPANSYGVTITGIDPQAEYQVTDVHTYLEEGEYMSPDQRRPILIGRELAEKLNLRLRSKIILNFQDLDENITGGAFRVAGIFKTPNSTFDESTVFVLENDLKEHLGADSTPLTHELLIRTDRYKRASTYADSLAQQFPNLEIRSWEKVAPHLSYASSSMDLTLYIFIGILILALTLGIINTMLMAVMERSQELGMLMAVGMNRPHIFRMILIETFYLNFVGAPIGLFLGWLTVYYTGTYGIDLSAFSEGLAAYGMSTVIHPSLDPIYYLNITIMIAVAALIAALYPAYKALSLNPVEAIRKL